MRLQVWAWRCELCRHTWLAVGIDAPEQCAKCRKRNWHKMGDCLDSGANLSNRPSEDGRRADCPPAKPDREALRDICAGKISQDGRLVLGVGSVPTYDKAEIPICGKQWWEDGVGYECLMDKGHLEQGHGRRGMVRRLEE